MQVVVRANRNGLAEWLMIELQGSLESPSPDLSGQTIGDLAYTKQGMPVLIIGHHALFGKESDLAKPLVVLVNEPLSDADGERRLEAIAVIRTKLIFKTRPRPIVTKLPVIKK